ncbi:hypothetical protein RN001_003463 [Aquatica leii]|uniref:Phospholipid-transporting ATPase n=1 Tax=Aquatica leii TaxID=1421715 RepID=A0AAN7SKS4_9COLE|nr:hypothetical protein RN001_003463 [Aquatica leii]
MSNSLSTGENVRPSDTQTDLLAVRGAQCATYTFPETRSPESRGHGRSASHGGSTTLGGNTSASAVGRPSALKTARGHQRAFSQGQITDSATGLRPGHSRVGSKTDFILPPGHKESENVINSGSRASAKGHSRQASRSESIYTLRRTAPPPLWRRLLCILLRRSPRGEQEERYRIVVPNHTVPPKTPRKEHPNGNRPNNKVRTTKYTLLSFLPRNLLEQFHRVANLYFIFIVLLNWFPAINAFGKEIAMIPVLFVLGVTAVKDLFEDRRRHASDKRVNNSTCRIYQSEAARYKKVLWKEVRVGDLIHLSNNEIVPADILLLRSSDPNGICYIDTGHLDGETNLKQRQVPRAFLKKQEIFEPSKFRSHIEVDAPTTKIYRFHGAMLHPSGAREPVGTENLLLRECLLKNTDYIEGIVVYAGHETKAMLNNGGPRYKRSTLERQMNQDIIWCVLVLIILCVIGAVGCKLWLQAYHGLKEPYKTEGSSDSTDAFLAFWTYIIILQIMIPLSLYVTLEMCKIIQVYHIHNNVDLYDAETDKRVECRALNITEELGQVQYIFSDKTGTLTENRMIFRRCTIAGVDYNHPHLENEGKGVKPGAALTVLVNPKLKEDLNLGQLSEQGFTAQQKHAARIQEFFLLLAVCNTVVCSHHPHCDLMNASGVIEPAPNVFEESGCARLNNLQNSSDGQNHSNDKYERLKESRSVTPSPPLNPHLYSDNSYRPIHVTSLTPINSVNSSPIIDEVAQNTVIKSSFMPKLLNIPSLPFLGNKRNGSTSNLTDEQKAKLHQSSSSFDTKPIFEAESPDELALVDAAYNYNCRLLKRNPGFVLVDVPGEGILEYEILHVLPFDSDRKRMSVILKHPASQEIIVFCKGADSSIFPCLAPVEDDSEQKQIISRTQQQLNNYASKGLRVLVMAKRILSVDEYTEWVTIHQEYELLHDNRDKKLQESYSALEKKLTLLGATGIEDRLQEGVPETLASLIASGIVVWVLTGDKPETAINIAYSAKLFNSDMEVLKIMARSKKTAEDTIKFYLSDIEQGMDGTSSEVNIRRTPDSSSTNELLRRPRSSQRKHEKALVVDGKSLTYILDKRSNLTKHFLKLTTYCTSVLCCRATPLQKAYIVKVVKEELKMRTLAIGDGANDVSMIQTADVGIGISGQEGMQAVMAADFALSRFKYLERFLLVHGHWSYDRLARMVLYFFYKNAAFVFLIFWYQLFCGFSGAVMIDQMYLMLYNLLFTSLPPLAIGVYDQDSPEELLRQKPYLYRKGRLGKVYRSFSFWLTLADALYQSIAIFFICIAAYNDTVVDIWEFGTTLTTICMFVMSFHVSIEIKSWTIIHIASILVSIGAFYIYSLLYNSLCVNCFGLPSTYWVIQHAIVTPKYWLCTMLSVVVALLPRFTFLVIKNTVGPDDVTKAILSYRQNIRRESPIIGIQITL